MTVEDALGFQSDDPNAPCFVGTPNAHPDAHPDADADADDPTPGINLAVLSPICDNDVPYLQYTIAAVGFVPTTVTITWVNPTGPDVVYTNQALSGRVLWAGAVADSAGNPLDWPGWRFENGVWVEGDEFDWVRPRVTVQFDVNPTQVVTVGYPPSTPSCDANPPQGGPSLATTGGGNGGLIAAGAILMASGAGLVLAGRRVGRHHV